MAVLAAVLGRHGEPPTLRRREAPAAEEGEVLVDVAAVPITPLDVLCASGTSYFGPPALPYVPGVQGVGTVRSGGTLAPGTPVWFTTPAGMGPGDGSFATVCAVPQTDVLPLEHDGDATLVAALGLSAIAGWMALTWRGDLREGEQVVVLGAGGVVGQVALQAARLHGARRIVAGCRSDAATERAQRYGADAVVRLDTDDLDILAERFRAVADGPVDLVLDPLFGAPAAAALRALGQHGRLVNLGDAAGATAPIDSATLRGRSLRVLGYTNNELTARQKAAALRDILGHAAAGRLAVDYETVPFGDVAEAWARQAGGRAARRIVLRLP